MQVPIILRIFLSVKRVASVNSVLTICNAPQNLSEYRATSLGTLPLLLLVQMHNLERVENRSRCKGIYGLRGAAHHSGGELRSDYNLIL